MGEEQDEESRYPNSGCSKGRSGTRIPCDTESMLRKVTPWRHAVAGFAVAGVASLAGFGVIGAGDQSVLRGEHYDAKHVTVRPEGADGLRIREVIDIDFGFAERRGVQRIIPNDFGEPIDVVASSPDANDELSVSPIGGSSRLRVGNPNITFTGQHRYVLEYTLPEARVSGGQLALDIIGTDETLETDRFAVVVDGFDFATTECATGRNGTVGGCELEALGDGRYGVVFEPLKPSEGITIGGQINGTFAASFGEVVDEVEENPSGFRPLGLLMIPLGALAAVGVFLFSRWYGSNEVSGGGGAADAAYGELPKPKLGDPVADVPTYRVPDSRLAQLATIEFVPPRGVEPWQGTALLSEQVDDDTVMAWFSEMIAREAISIEEDGGDAVLRRGPHSERLHAIDQQHLTKLFGSSASVELGSYDKNFTSTWSQIKREQQRFIADAEWWSRGVGSGGTFKLSSLSRLVVPVIFLFVIGGAAAGGIIRLFFGSFSSAPTAIVLGMMAVALAAFGAYKSMLPSRSATGSALALRTESFRRFLAASEGRHVEWAWENNVLREYSAWAVALGAADAWTRAVESSNIPHPELALRGPLLVHTSSRSFDTSRVPPSSSGSGGFGGGGFSGGSVGGGGGGGSSGSW